MVAQKGRRVKFLRPDAQGEELNLPFPILTLRSSKSGMSLIQGPHQFAQKSRTTTLPLKSDSLTLLPSTVLSFQSGAQYQ